MEAAGVTVKPQWPAGRRQNLTVKRVPTSPSHGAQEPVPKQGSTSHTQRLEVSMVQKNGCVEFLDEATEAQERAVTGG